jgi:hypothetical protein
MILSILTSPLSISSSLRSLGEGEERRGGEEIRGGEEVDADASSSEHENLSLFTNFC